MRRPTVLRLVFVAACLVGGLALREAARAMPLPAAAAVSATASCATPAGTHLGIGAQDLVAIMGCPSAAEQGTDALIEQRFQNGFMIWVNRTIDVVYPDGSWTLYVDTFVDGQDPEQLWLNTPPGLFEPKRGFGKVWRTNLGGLNATIGLATESEHRIHAYGQTFANGTVVRTDSGLVAILDQANETSGPSVASGS